MAKFAPHMGDPHGDPQTSPQHADPHGFLVWFSLKRGQLHVDVVGWSAGRHVDHPCAGQISPWPARKVPDKRKLRPFGKRVSRKNFVAQPQLGIFFCPEICAFTGFGARFLQPFPKVLSDGEVLLKHNDGR